MFKLAIVALACMLALDYVVGQTAGMFAQHLFKQVLEVLP